MSIFQDLPTTLWAKSVKSPLPLVWGTPKWLRSWVRAALRVAMLPAAPTRTQYLRHFDASNVQLMGPDPRSRARSRRKGARPAVPLADQPVHQCVARAFRGGDRSREAFVAEFVQSYSSRSGIPKPDLTERA